MTSAIFKRKYMTHQASNSKKTASRWALSAFLLLMFLKFSMIWFAPVSDKLNGDTGEYVDKAKYFLEHKAFRPVDTEKGKDINSPRAYSDFRPPGYAMLVAMGIYFFGDNNNEINFSSRIANFFLDFATSAILLWVCWSISESTIFRLLASLIVGIQPWTSAFVTAVYPDTVVTFLSVAGVALLAKFSVEKSRPFEKLYLVAAGGVLSIGSLIRPEMIIVPPILIVAGLYIKYTHAKFKNSMVLLMLLSVVPLAMVTSMNIAYRWNVAKQIEIFGRLEQQTPGLLNWTKTWIGSNKAKEDILWGPFEISKQEFNNLPDHAFSGPEEKKLLSDIADQARARGFMTRQEDEIFANIADARKAAKPFFYWVAIPVFYFGNFWVNSGSASYYLTYQAALPSIVSKAITGIFLTLKFALVGLACIGFYVAGRTVLSATRRNEEKVTWPVVFIALGSVFVLTRTVVFTWLLSAFEFRYSVPGWPFVITSALFGIFLILQSGDGSLPARKMKKSKNI